MLNALLFVPPGDSFVKGRGNLIIDYSPEGAKGTLAFIGSHLDVVPANPSTWKRNPFKLVIEVRVPTSKSIRTKHTSNVAYAGYFVSVQQLLPLNCAIATWMARFLHFQTAVLIHFTHAQCHAYTQYFMNETIFRERSCMGVAPQTVWVM